MTNVLVNDNEGCMDLVKHAVKIVNSEKFYPLGVKPRTSLEIPVIVVHMHQINICYAEQYFYYPRQDTWSPIIASSGTPERAVSCHGRLYFFKYLEKTYCAMICFLAVGSVGNLIRKTYDNL